MQYGSGLTRAQWLGGAAAVALAYVFVYRFNNWLFDQAKVSDFVSWIFLPAAIRMVAVLLLGWAGVAGLFVGSLLTIVPVLVEDPAHALTLATLSSVMPILAAFAVQKLAGISADLSGLKGRHLFLFGLAGGLVNSVAHITYFVLHDANLSPLGTLPAMFVGDSIGTLVMLYAAAVVMRRLVPPPP